MNSRLIRLVVAIAAFSGHFTASAYELGTHARITYKAYEQSVLKQDSELIEDLGIDLTDPDNPFDTQYYDVSDSDIRVRDVTPFEEGFMTERPDNPNPVIPPGMDPLSLPGWLLRGAIREDDLGQLFGFAYGRDPHDDPDGPFWRVMHHFYDPVNNTALTISPVCQSTFSTATGDSTDFHAAPNWAMGSQDAFAPSPVPEDGRRNHFTVFDAREAMYRALTGKNQNGDDVAPTKDDRNKYWATLFRALGDIVHLVQDMAQPQHTRNDPHANAPCFGHESAYEAYLDCRATGGPFEYIDNYQDYYIDSCYSLTYGNHPIPVFTRYADYFATRDGTGRGLAEYSNRNFFTAGTNLGSNNYPSPSNNRGVYDEEAFLQFDTLGFQRTVRFLRGDVTDTRTGETNNIRLTTESAFDYFLGTARAYSLNAYNYDDQADLLIPRAVAYSAGFMDYFFRGRIEVEDAHYADAGIKLKIKNALDPEKYPEWQNEILYAKNSSDAPSTLRIAYEYQDENNITRYGTSDAVDLNTSNGDDDVAPGNVSREVYSFPMTIPSGRIRNLKYRLVFRGRQGNEDDAVVAAAFKPVSGFLVKPNYLPQDEIPGARMIYKTATGWKLAPDEGLVAGNIDWKGWYENGKPMKVLSWMGPTSRYFGVPLHGGGITNDPNNESEENLSAPEIYHNGEIFSVAPLPILGSALIKDANNKTWIVAACRDGYADVVYRRPYKKSTSAAIYNPDTAKDGWREIGRSIPGPGDREPGTPWFFKGDGTEAQAMRKWIDPNDPNERVQLKRLIVRVDIDAPSAAVSPKSGDPVGFVRNTQCSANHDADGAGTGTITHDESGSYVIAVDYDNMTEVLGVIDENSSGNTTTTVTVTKDADGNITSTQISTKVSDNQAASLTLYPGGAPLTLLQSSSTNIDGVISDTYKMAEIAYYLDLRKKLYAYYWQEWDQTEQKVSDTTASGAGDYAERMYVSPEEPPNLFNNTYSYSYSYTTQIIRPDGVFSCASSYPATTRYEPNFGWVDNLDIGGGGWAVDAEGNVLVSQKFYSDAGYEVHDAFNYLKDGDINALLGATAGAPAYYPVGVLH